MDRQTQEFKCLRKGCEKTFQTLSGRSKHHKKCSYQRRVSEKGYTVLEESNKIKGGKVFSVVSNWYKHNRNAHINQKKKKIHKCIVSSKEFDHYPKMKQHDIVQKPTCVKLVIVVFDAKIITLLM